jgi:transposase InsO family protein
LELVSQSPRYGYRQITRLLRIEGWRVNAKRIYRLWRREGLKVPQKKAKRTRQGSTEGGITRRKAEYRNHVWSMDFIFDTTSNGRPLKILSMIDEYTRECIALEVGRKFNSDDLVQLLIELFGIRGVPKFIRCDNGPEFISNRLRKFLQRIDVGASYVEPGSPWQNGYIESFHSRFRDECLGCEEFRTVAEAIAVITHWRQGYNHRRPHSSLGGLTPAEFSSQCAASDRPTASLQQHTADSVPQPLLS